MLKKKEDGVSLIALVITIIVVLILAAITFSNSDGTIGKADYSKFVTNIVEVQESIAQKATAVKGKSVSSGKQMTDEQAYNYVASGGKTEDDVLPKGRIPDYTIIEKTADIGMKLPVMKVNTKTSSKAEVTYAITKLGKVFIWPPYEYDGKYIIDETSEVSEATAEATGFIDITVAGVPLRISTNTKGELEQIELLDDGLTKKEFDEILTRVEVGNYVNYKLTTQNTVITSPNRTGVAATTLKTNTSAQWRILSIDKDTGRVLITTNGPVNINEVKLEGVEGYLYGPDELNRICDKLYSANGFTARSITIEDLNKACNYTPIAEEDQLRYAWYPSDATDIKDVEVKTENGIKTYTARKHLPGLATGLSKPQFYVWDDASGVTHTARNENAYNADISAKTPILSSRTWYGYNPGMNNSVINEIIGGNGSTTKCWLASQAVYIHEEFACARFVLRTAYSGGVYGDYLCNSAGYVNSPSYSLHPVVEFSSKLLDMSDTEKNGTASAPWEIKQN